MAGGASGLVFLLWYRPPYNEISGGAHLFYLLIAVDVVCGPILTAILANPKKKKKELLLDFSLVIVIQMMALSYGLYFVFQARPVVIAFEVDRMVVVAAAEIDSNDLTKAPPALRKLSWGQPKFIGTRKPISNEEMMDALDHSLQGLEPSARPGWWQDFSKSIPDIRSRAKNLSQLMVNRSAGDRVILQEVIRKSGKNEEELFYLPLTSRRTKDWVIVFAYSRDSLDISGYAPVDGFLN